MATSPAYPTPSSPPLPPSSPYLDPLHITPPGSPLSQQEGDDIDAEDAQLPVDPWKDYTIDPPLDTDPDLYPAKPSPPDDNVAYQELHARAAEYHGVALYKESLEEDFLFETHASTHRSSQTLPMLKGMMRYANDIFKDPVQALILTPRVDKKLNLRHLAPSLLKVICLLTPW